ncbi:FtsW/RodA/SpoVE family cell cycle protein [Pollutibacter soli]|uniref:FtsW/RodA/SpoVE family cell cycle protein n=1 Tax=Pollutibacter soli TaxID=3034157 RepID=UPI003013DE29
MSVRERNNRIHNGREAFLMLTGSAVILMLLFYRLYLTIIPSLERTESEMQKNNAVLLDENVQPETIYLALKKGNYFRDENDMRLVSDSLAAKLKSGLELPNLGALNKSQFQVRVPAVTDSSKTGSSLRERLLASRIRLGFDSALFESELYRPITHPSSVKIADGDKSIRGNISAGNKSLNGVLVQLKEHFGDPALDSSRLRNWFARTGANGEYEFTGLHTDSGYSVLPLKPGFEFGARKGSAWLKKNASYDFNGKPHTIPLLGTAAYGQIREDGVFMVRTPESFRTIYWLIAGSLIFSFFIAQLVAVFRKQQPDPFLLPVLLLLCGISILLMFSIQDPLADTLYASQVLQGVIVGLFAYSIFSAVNISRMHSKWWFDFLFNFKQKQTYALRGWTWLALAVLLSLVTLFFGTGPEGSGVKVNLRLGPLLFQPGEITKYLLLIFLAAFFASNFEKLRNFSDIRWRFLTSWTVLISIAAILFIYLLMGDMGPALVVCFTFLFFYCIARGNLLFTLLTGLVYGVLLWLMPPLVATAACFAWVIVISFLLGHMKSMRWYGFAAVIADAPVIIMLVIAAFVFGEQVPGIGSRLADRKAIWQSPWDNDVYGGDHVAHSYWTMASGGPSGTGIGRGYPNTMPAAHTDMILPSIGEELGWTGLVAIFLLFGILIHRIFLFARKSGHPFSFYLSAGIGIALGLQLLLIAGGSIGLLPLTGITAPFLSYGKISLIINLAALGIVAGISARPGKQKQQEFISKHHDPVLITGISFFLIGILILSVQLFRIQISSRDEFLAKPSRVIMKNGLPIYSYNPRINKLMNLVAAGNIYDRNGVLVATSEKQDLIRSLDALHKAGIPEKQLEELSHSRVKRYYPFEEDLFYWTGDYNSKIFWGQNNGYFAEARHLTALRGYGVSRIKIDSVHVNYQPDRFTKPFLQGNQLLRYDFASLVNGLKHPIDSTNPDVIEIRSKDRNIQLAVDASLQKEIQDSLQQSRFNNKRMSVVVLDASTGDLLSSAMNPLPNLQSPELMDLPEREKLLLPTPISDRDPGMTYATAPGSTVKILTALAGLNKLGTDAAAVKYNDISRNEIFRDNPTEQEPFVPKVKFVDMHEAIVHSSNIFFIRLANDYDLEDHMAALYKATGMNLHQTGGYNYRPTEDHQQEEASYAIWRNGALKKDRRAYLNPEYKGKTKRYRSDFSGLAWGQSVLTSTPASMARMAGAIANEGMLMPSRYTLVEAGQTNVPAKGVMVAADSSYAGIIKKFMYEQSNAGKQKIKSVKVAGKTGTPERIIRGERMSDGWYVFFAPTPEKKSNTVVCIRIEEGLSSANAVLVANTVADILAKRKYME